LGGKGNASALTIVDQTIDGANSSLNAYFRTMAHNSNIDDRNAYTDVVKRLAYQGVVNGQVPAEAAKKAMSALTDQFVFTNPSTFGPARIPKNMATVVQYNANTFKNTLSPDKVLIPNDAASPQDYVRELKLNGQYITNNDETGLWMLNNNGSVVQDKTGKPITIPFAMTTKNLTDKQALSTDIGIKGGGG